MHQILMRQMGNLGNRMIQYAFATFLSERLGGCEIVGVRLPEWGLMDDVPALPTPSLFDAVIEITDFNVASLSTIVTAVRNIGRLQFFLNGYFQNVDCLPPKNVLIAENFPPSKKFVGKFDHRQLVINIRAGDILSGYICYPIVPIEFYQTLVKQTGLEPVFVGQVDEKCLYIDQLREAFPHAQYISTGSPIDDFELVRSAKHICLAVSTFSWLAAWLSDAVDIRYPMLGFLNPALNKSYDLPPFNLLPTGDARYRFYLFPLVYGNREGEMLRQNAVIGGQWPEIAASQVQKIMQLSSMSTARKSWPILPFEHFDELFYVHNNIEAAVELAHGFYSCPEEHYCSIGRARGYAASPPVRKPHGRNVAAGKSATQSSTFEDGGPSDPPATAAGAVDGVLAKEYGCHTRFEANPWWRCDLGENFVIEVINIFNRRSKREIRERLFPFSVLTSEDDVDYRCIFESDDRTYIGGGGYHSAPIQIVPPADALSTRYIKIVVRSGHSCLHVAQVEVYA